jgi:hypothetical protein
MSPWQLLFQHELAAWVHGERSLLLWWPRRRCATTNTAVRPADRTFGAEQCSTDARRHSFAWESDLAKRLIALSSVALVQHKIDHLNRAPVSERGPSEMAAEWNTQEIAARLNATKLQCMPNWIPVFVSLWHVVHPCLETALATIGFTGTVVNRRHIANCFRPSPRSRRAAREFWTRTRALKR